jgi:hypothetical protein
MTSALSVLHLHRQWCYVALGAQDASDALLAPVGVREPCETGYNGLDLHLAQEIDGMAMHYHAGLDLNHS